MVKKLLKAVILLFVVLLGRNILPVFADSGGGVVSSHNSICADLYSRLAYDGKCSDGVSVSTNLTTPEQIAGISEKPLPTYIAITPAPSSSDTSIAIVQPIAASTSSHAAFQATLPIQPQPSLNADILFTLINSYRTQAGLAPFSQDAAVCSVALSRAPELYNEIMVTHTMHAGFYARHLPYQATENVIYMKTEQEAVNWWLNSPIHRAAIFGNYKYSCIACSGNSCSEIFATY